MQTNSEIKKIKNLLLNLLNKALNNISLNKKEFDFIVDIIEINPSILNDINFGPDMLFELIEKNDKLAAEILLKISSHKNFVDYISHFFTSKLSCNSLKVMYQLINKIEFPPFFITSYFKHIIKEFECENNLIIKKRFANIITYSLLFLLKNSHITIEMIPLSINAIFKEKYDVSNILELEELIKNGKN